MNSFYEVFCEMENLALELEVLNGLIFTLWDSMANGSFDNKELQELVLFEISRKAEDICKKHKNQVCLGFDVYKKGKEGVL